MIKEGLLVEPEFNNISKYLQSGERTKVTDEIKEVSEKIKGQTGGVLIRNILVWMHQNTSRLQNSRDSRKFKRTAFDIFDSRDCAGCCDSSTLFTALARSKNIPTMQIITLSKEWGRRLDIREKLEHEGHYFVACYLSDAMEKYDWVLIDPDRNIRDVRDVRLSRLNKENRNIDKDYYAFAYIRDYSDMVYNGIKIDSIENMIKIQIAAYRQCNIKDFSYEDERER